MGGAGMLLYAGVWWTRWLPDVKKMTRDAALMLLIRTAAAIQDRSRPHQHVPDNPVIMNQPHRSVGPTDASADAVR